MIPYNAEESFQKQIKDNMNLNDDKALLKIINKNGIFYLESATYLNHAEDLKQVAET